MTIGATARWIVLFLFLPGLSQAQPTVDGVTFNRDIAPIVFEHCAACHRPGEAAPFSLLTYEDVSRRARQIAAVTARGYMPPWKPSGEHGRFAGERRLPRAERETIERWIATGLARGSAADLPPTPTWTDGWQLGTPDLIVRLPEPYTLKSDGPDIIRNFVVPLGTATPRYVSAVEFRPGNARVAHHATMLIDQTPASRTLDAEDLLPGYDGILPYSAKQPDGHFLGWTPGQAAIRSDNDMAWQLNPSSDLVVSLHMRPTGKPETIQFSVGLFFTDQAPTRVPFIIQLGQQNLDIAPGNAEYVSEDRYTLPVDVEVRGVQPHAHYLCRTVEATATLPGGERKQLIEIADWDFNWQAQYRYAAPIVLPRGTVLSMRYTYDNSPRNPRNPWSPPRRVIYGQDSRDEMAELLLQVLPDSPADRLALERDFRAKALHDTTVGYRMMLSSHPENVNMHNDLAMLSLATGDTAGAIEHFGAVARRRPDRAEARYNLGVAMAMAGRWDEAIAEYRRALAALPDYAQAHNNLGAALAARGLAEDAQRHYLRALQLTPDYVDARVNLAVLLQRQGRGEDAVREYRLATAADPRHAVAHNGLGSALQSLGQVEAAMGAYREALRLAPAYAEARYNLGTALEQQGRTADAIEQYQAGLNLYEPAAPTAEPAGSATLDSTALARRAEASRQRLAARIAGRPF